MAGMAGGGLRGLYGCGMIRAAAVFPKGVGENAAGRGALHRGCAERRKWVRLDTYNLTDFARLLSESVEIEAP
jgi:hypothetical protein